MSQQQLYQGFLKFLGHEIGRLQTIAATAAAFDPADPPPPRMRVKLYKKAETGGLGSTVETGANGTTFTATHIDQPMRVIQRICCGPRGLQLRWVWRYRHAMHA